MSNGEDAKRDDGPGAIGQLFTPTGELTEKARRAAAGEDVQFADPTGGLPEETRVASGRGAFGRPTSTTPPDGRGGALPGGMEQPSPSEVIPEDEPGGGGDAPGPPTGGGGSGVGGGQPVGGGDIRGGMELPSPNRAAELAADGQQQQPPGGGGGRGGAGGARGGRGPDRTPTIITAATAGDGQQPGMQQPSDGRRGVEPPSVSQGIETDVGGTVTDRVQQQARLLEQQVLAENMAISDPSDVAITREGDTLRARLTRGGFGTRAIQNAIEDSALVDEASDVRLEEAGGLVSLSLTPSGIRDIQQDGAARRRDGTAGVTEGVQPAGEPEPVFGDTGGILSAGGALQRPSPDVRAETEAALAEERLETQTFTATVPADVPIVGGRDLFTLEGRGREVDVTAETERTEKGTRTTFDVDEREQFEEPDIPLTPGVAREFGGLGLDREVTFEDVFEGIRGQAVSEAERLTDPPEAKQRDNLFFEPGVDNPLERFVEGEVTGGVSFATGLPLIAKEAAGFGLSAGEALVEGRGGEFAEKTASAAVGRGILVGEQFQREPIKTAGTFAGGALVSGGAIGAAGKLGGPAAGRATSFAIQPGEELAITAARRGAIPTRVASAVGDLSPAAIRGEAGRFAAAERGQLQIGRQRQPGDGGEERLPPSTADLADVAGPGEGLGPVSRERTPGFEAGPRPRGTERSRFAREETTAGAFGPRTTTELERGPEAGRGPSVAEEFGLEPPTAEADVGATTEPGLPGSDLGVLDFLRLETGEALERAEAAVAPPVTEEDPVTMGVLEETVTAPVVGERGALAETGILAEQGATTLGEGVLERTLERERETGREREVSRERETGREREVARERQDVRTEPIARADVLETPRTEPRTELETRLEGRAEPRTEPRQEPRTEFRFEGRAEPRQEFRFEGRTEFRLEPFLFGDEKDDPEKKKDRREPDFLEQQLVFDVPSVGDILGAGF